MITPRATVSLVIVGGPVVKKWTFTLHVIDQMLHVWTHSFVSTAVLEPGNDSDCRVQGRHIGVPVEEEVVRYLWAVTRPGEGPSAHRVWLGQRMGDASVDAEWVEEGGPSVSRDPCQDSFHDLILGSHRWIEADAGEWVVSVARHIVSHVGRLRSVTFSCVHIRHD